MKRGRKDARIELAPDERATLDHWARCRESAPARAERAKIILECARGRSNRAVAEAVDVTPQTVSKWRGRFMKDRVIGLGEGIRASSDGRSIHQRDLLRIEKLMSNEPPPGGQTWSTRLVAERSGLSQSKVCRIARAMALLPGRWEAAKLTLDGFPRARVAAIAGVLFDPPEHLLAFDVAPECARTGGNGSADEDPGHVGGTGRATFETSEIIAEVERRALLASRPRGGSGIQRVLGFVASTRRSIPSDRELHLLYSDGRHSTAPALEYRMNRMARTVLHVVPPGISWHGLFSAWLAHLHPGCSGNGSNGTGSGLPAALQEFVSGDTLRLGVFCWPPLTKNVAGAPDP